MKTTIALLLLALVGKPQQGLAQGDSRSATTTEPISQAQQFFALLLVRADHAKRVAHQVAVLVGHGGLPAVVVGGLERACNEAGCGMGARPSLGYDGLLTATIAKEGGRNGKSRTTFCHPKHGRADLVRDVERRGNVFNGGGNLFHRGDSSRCEPDACRGTEVRSETGSGNSSSGDPGNIRPVAPHPQCQRPNGSLQRVDRTTLLLLQRGHCCAFASVAATAARAALIRAISALNARKTSPSSRAALVPNCVGVALCMAQRCAQAVMSTTSSGVATSAMGGLLGGEGGAEVGPIDCWAQVLAANLTIGEALNLGAVLSRYRPDAGNPLAYCSSCEAKRSCESSLSAKLGACVLYWAHALNLALLSTKRKPC